MTAPSIEAALAMGATGGPVVEAERLAFEAWMRGHCWALTATWDGKTYRGTAEHGSYICPHAMQVRQLWAAWRDRAALATGPTEKAKKCGSECDYICQIPDGFGGCAKGKCLVPND